MEEHRIIEPGDDRNDAGNDDDDAVENGNGGGGNVDDDDDAVENLDADGGGARLPQLEDLDAYVRRYGLGGHNGEGAEGGGGRGGGADVIGVASSDRVRAERAYQESVHRSIFGASSGGGGKRRRTSAASTDAESKNDGGGEDDGAPPFRGMTVDVFASGGKPVRRGVDLCVLALRCDAVHRMARTRPFFCGGKEGRAGKGRSEEGAGTTATMVLSLDQFGARSVSEFLTLVLEGGGDDSDDGGELSSSSESSSSSSKPSRTALDLPDGETLIECCHIAHYLQARSVYDDTLSVLESSIDADNCLSMCHLANRLDAPSLFEAALSKLLSSYDDVTSHGCWDDESFGMPTDLKRRIEAMRDAMRSSVLPTSSSSEGGGGNVVFAASPDEFLAVVSDSIREQRERLDDARRRQEEVAEEGGWTTTAEAAVTRGDVRDAERKIERQERRIRTLESFYEEQRRIFSRGELLTRGASESSPS